MFGTDTGTAYLDGSIVCQTAVSRFKLLKNKTPTPGIYFLNELKWGYMRWNEGRNVPPIMVMNNDPLFLGDVWNLPSALLASTTKASIISSTCMIQSDRT